MKHLFSNKHFVAIFLITTMLVTACGDQAPQKPFTVGIVAETTIHLPIIEGFKSGMADLGYVEGKNIVYVDKGLVDPQNIEAELENLVTQKVDLIFATGMYAVEAKQATEGTDIPIVFGSMSGPIDWGLVESIQHPGGNVTGIQVGGEIPKALEWLMKVTPGAKKISAPYNPNDEPSVMTFGLIEGVASQLNIELVPSEIHSVEEAVTLIENLPEDIDAIFRLPSPTLDPENSKLSQAAIRRGLPTASGHPLDEAMLLTLGSNMFAVGEQSAHLADQIHDGIKPADLPVGTAEFIITVNLQTAEAIGIEIPEELLLQADTIIR